MPISDLQIALCVALLAGAPALAKGPTSKTPQSGGTAPRTSKAQPDLVDHHFQCNLQPAKAAKGTAKSNGVDLKPWTSGGIADVPASLKAKFKSLGTLRTAADFAKFKKLCPKLPDKLGRLVSGPGTGNMSSASLIVALQDVPIYRAYSTPAIQCGLDRPSGEFGNWWSITALPAGSHRDDYRKKMAVCPSWNDFHKKVSCTLKKGSVIAVGPTQSMDCTADNTAKRAQSGCAAVIAKWTNKFPTSGNHQVYLNMYGRDADRPKFLVNCTSADWR